MAGRADTLLELFARRWPVDPATVLVEVPGGPMLTYEEADRRSARYAGALRQLGVARGDRVAAQIETPPEVLVLHLACLRLGAALLPLNPASTAAEVAHVTADAEPAVFVSDSARTSAPDGPGSVSVAVTLDGRGGGSLAELAAEHPDDHDDVAVDPDDLAALLYTSGTTGRPKGAMLTHGNLASNAAALHAAWGFDPDDVVLHALPLFHAHGLFVASHCALANGTGMVMLPRFDADLIVAHLPRATVFMGVPTHYARLLDHPDFDEGACSRTRLLISGSAPLTAATHERIRRRTGHVVLERYGMTETVMITSNPLHGERRAGTVGPPLPGVEVRITGATARDDDVSEGIGVGVGDVEVRGPNVFAGYWRRPDLTATEVTGDGWFRTGDLGHLDPDGYLNLVGRSKDLVITGGLNVYPREVEAVLDAQPGVAESAVVGVPDPDWGEAVVAAVVVEPGATLDPERLRDDARRHLAPYKLPKRVHVVEALPRNAMGKVEKATLRQQLCSPTR